MANSPQLDEQWQQIIYKVMTATVGPRPIAWVSSKDRQNHINLAPFSFFNVASVNPPILAFSTINASDQQAKDTANNLRQHPECVFNIFGEPLVNEMNQTCAPLAADEDEFAFAGLAKADMPKVSVPRVAAAPFAFGCVLHDIYSFGEHAGAGQLIMARVVSVYADPEYWDGKHVDMDKLQLVGRMVGDDYVRTADRFALKRPS